MSASKGRRFGVALVTGAALLGLVAAPAVAASPQANASAQAANITLSGSTYQSSNPPTTATNDGSGSTDPVVNKPGPLPSSALVGSTGPQAEVAQAGTDGSSYACAGQGGLGFALPATCQVTPGVGTVILRLDAMPVIGDALAGTPCPHMQLRYHAVAAHAVAGPGTTPSGDTTISGMTFLPCQLATEPLDCRTIGLDPGTGPNIDLLAMMIAAMSAPGCAPMVTALQGIQDKVEFQINHQSTDADGVFQVVGLHFATLGATSGFDIGTATVGPNSTPVVDASLISSQPLWWLGGLAVLAMLVAVRLRSRLARREAR